MSNVKLIPGLFALLRMAGERNRRFQAADAEFRPDPVMAMAKRMHPESLALKVKSVRNEVPLVKTYRLKSASGEPLPVFQAGQYISLKLQIGQTATARAYTISSAPYEAEGADGYYEITIRQKPEGFVSDWLFQNLQEGVELAATGPHGDFTVSPLRDTHEIVAVAGGAGVTPFVSMMKQFLLDRPELSVTLLYGCRNPEDILFEQEIDAVIQADPKRFRRFNTFEDNGGNASLRKGYLDAAFIKEHIPESEQKTFFICGPAVMYSFLQREFPKVAHLERKQTRYEVSGAPCDVTRIPGYPAAYAERTFTVSVLCNGVKTEIPASGAEPLLTAIERAGLILDSRCRSGECGICRSQL
ncbi:MAG TPA: iron-sulfur cluster-binding domain-containing protein, partial [Feifaniaceae bacterium]|nr:iron-sulfur cluster-binding domain-containing protein [Feifaniaceae bacterium]